MKHPASVNKPADLGRPLINLPPGATRVVAMDYCDIVVAGKLVRRGRDGAGLLRWQCDVTFRRWSGPCVTIPVDAATMQRIGSGIRRGRIACSPLILTGTGTLAKAALVIHAIRGGMKV